MCVAGSRLLYLLDVLGNAVVKTELRKQRFSSYFWNEWLLPSVLPVRCDASVGEKNFRNWSEWADTECGLAELFAGFHDGVPSVQWSLWFHSFLWKRTHRSMESIWVIVKIMFELLYFRTRMDVRFHEHLHNDCGVHSSITEEWWIPSRQVPGLLVCSHPIKEGKRTFVMKWKRLSRYVKKKIIQGVACTQISTYITRKVVTVRKIRTWCVQRTQKAGLGLNTSQTTHGRHASTVKGKCASFANSILFCWIVWWTRLWRCFRQFLFVGLHLRIFVRKFLARLRPVYASPKKLARPLYFVLFRMRIFRCLGASTGRHKSHAFQSQAS